MDNYTLVIDISSDEENQRYSTPIKTLPVNMIRTLNLSDSSVEVWRGSEADLDLSTFSASTFESGCSPKKIKISPIKKQNARVTFALGNERDTDSENDYFEEPETPRQLPPRHAPVLTEISNIPSAGSELATKKNELNDLDEPSLKEIEALYRLEPEDREFYATVARGRSHRPTRAMGPRQQTVSITREVPTATLCKRFVREGPCRDPLPVSVSYAALEYQASGEDVEEATVNTVKPNFN